MINVELYKTKSVEIRNALSLVQTPRFKFDETAFERAVMLQSASWDGTISLERLANRINTYHHRQEHSYNETLDMLPNLIKDAVTSTIEDCSNMYNELSPLDRIAYKDAFAVLIAQLRALTIISCAQPVLQQPPAGERMFTNVWTSRK